MSKVKLAFVGDVMCGDMFYSLGFGVASGIREYGDQFLDPEIIKYFKKHDIVLCNVESVLSNVGRLNNSLRKMDMRGDPESAKKLANWGITIANVANNHILEQGLDASLDTVTNLKNAGIKVIGAGKNEQFLQGVSACEITIKDQQFVFMGICLVDNKYSFNGGAEIDELISYIKTYKNRKKVIIVSIHWGNEYINRPSIKQEKLGRKLLEAGAVMIIGHHPHVVHGLQNIHGKLIAYSLGNFIFGGFLQETKWSIILSATVSNNKVIDIEIIPIVTDDENRPCISREEKKEEILNEINKRNMLVARNIDEWDSEEKYTISTSNETEYFRKQLKFHLLKNRKKIRSVFWPQILLRPIRRRIGLW